MRRLFAFLLLGSHSLFCQKSFSEAQAAWLKAHPPPKGDVSPQEREAYRQARADAVALLVKQWPEEPSAWIWYVQELNNGKTTPNSDLERVGEITLQKLAEHPMKDGFRAHSPKTTVARIWNEHNIRLEQCITLAREGAEEVLQNREASPSMANMMAHNVRSGLSESYQVEAEAASKLKKFDVANAALGEMKKQLDEDPQDKPWLEPGYWLTAGEVAEAEGHKADALTFYSLVANHYPGDHRTEARLRSLWKELGGTEDGWTAWRSAWKPAAPPPMQMAKPDPWTELNKSLAQFKGTDLKGRSWSVDDFKGKTTLVSIWATWCTPCRAELPLVQEIFDQMKHQSDVQIVTLDIDEDPAATVQFINKRPFTFPVIRTDRRSLDEMVGFAGIPRTWIVDANGHVRSETLAYRQEEWPDQIMTRLTRAMTAYH